MTTKNESIVVPDDDTDHAIARRFIDTSPLHDLCIDHMSEADYSVIADAMAAWLLKENRRRG